MTYDVSHCTDLTQKQAEAIVIARNLKELWVLSHRGLTVFSGMQRQAAETLMAKDFYEEHHVKASSDTLEQVMQKLWKALNA